MILKKIALITEAETLLGDPSKAKADLGKAKQHGFDVAVGVER